MKIILCKKYWQNKISKIKNVARTFPILTQGTKFKNKIIQDKLKYFYCVFTAQTRIRLSNFHVYIRESVQSINKSTNS